ncbi:hypothetical protein [Spirosoma linguale]|uniref:Outer membrane protein beta-barrel domain-containing protein n=1 Tax=Spirosoma linguale (strain ATCC 33905 / DSM 74 / LMG 10896 / Claus 1) TaxID=504472 RepID=D2QEU1_SPILD|nr:hypothetical protein Slin_5316 [Spirosoma linguale DSM 74]
MKKINFSILLILGLLAGTQSFAQLAVDKGTKFLNLGIGVGGYGYFNGSGLGLNAGLDVGIIKNITVGGIAGFRGYGDGVSSFDIGARGSYHFNELLNLSTDKADLYAGIGISYYRLSYGDTYIRSIGLSDSYSTVYTPIHIGGRYFFSDKLGGFAELGSSLATLKLGLTLKL